MTSQDGRFVVVFNGEIYNILKLRVELETAGVRFRTTSDTEALLHLYAQYGAEMVHRLRGMFAFAIWDQARRGLFLARDPMASSRFTQQTTAGLFASPRRLRLFLAGGRVSRDPEPSRRCGLPSIRERTRAIHVYRTFALYRRPYAMGRHRGTKKAQALFQSRRGPIQGGREPNPGWLSLPNGCASACLDSGARASAGRR